MLGETGNLVMKVDVKENVVEGLIMANTELLEACISSGKANSVSGKANQVTQVSQTCSSYPKSSGSDRGYLKVILA
jgi:enolase